MRYIQVNIEGIGFLIDYSSSLIIEYYETTNLKRTFYL